MKISGRIGKVTYKAPNIVPVPHANAARLNLDLGWGKVIFVLHGNEPSLQRDTANYMLDVAKQTLMNNPITDDDDGTA